MIPGVTNIPESYHIPWEMDFNVKLHNNFDYCKNQQEVSVNVTFIVRFCSNDNAFWENKYRLKPWSYGASASASPLTLGLCLRMGMTLMLGVGCTGFNQCGPLKASTLTLLLTSASVWLDP